MTSHRTELTPGARIELDPGSSVSVDGVASAPARIATRDEHDGLIAVVIDVTGRLNHEDVRVHERLVCTWQQAGELVASVIVSATRAAQFSGEQDPADAFRQVLDAAIAREEGRE